MERIKPQIKSSSRKGESLPKAKKTAPGINSKSITTGKIGLQADNAKAESEFNRGAVKPWIPKGGHAPQTDLKVAPPKQMSVASGPGYSGKGYKKKK